MTIIARASTEWNTGTRLESRDSGAAKAIRENAISPEKVAGTTLLLSAEGKALFEQSQAATAEVANSEAPTKQPAIRIDGTEDRATLLSKFRKMSAEDKEFYIQGELSRYDDFLKGMQQLTENSTPLSTPKPSDKAGDGYISHERMEFLVRKMVDIIATDPRTVQHGKEVTQEFLARARPVSDTEFEQKQAIAAANEASANAPHANHLGYEENHTMYIPNIAHQTLEVAKKTLASVQDTISKREDVGLRFHSAYGDQIISDMATYLTAVQDYISKLEAGVPTPSAAATTHDAA